MLSVFLSTVYYFIAQQALVQLKSTNVVTHNVIAFHISNMKCHNFCRADSNYFVTWQLCYQKYFHSCVNRFSFHFPSPFLRLQHRRIPAGEGSRGSEHPFLTWVPQIIDCVYRIAFLKGSNTERREPCPPLGLLSLKFTGSRRSDGGDGANNSEQENKPEGWRQGARASEPLLTLFSFALFFALLSII